MKPTGGAKKCVRLCAEADLLTVPPLRLRLP